VDAVTNIDTARLLDVFSTEVWLGVLALVLITVDLVVGRGRLTGPADMVRLLSLVGLALVLWHAVALDPLPEASGAWGTLDAFALFFKRFFVGAALATLVLSAPYDARFPAGRAEFPILIVNLTGEVPERTLLRYARELQDAVEALEPVLEAGIAGERDEMLEVVIDPLRLEAYNVTADELIRVVTNNNLLVAAGEIETEAGAFAVKIPSSFDSALDVYDLPGLAKVRQAVNIPIEADESCFSYRDAEAVVRAQAADVLNIKIAKTGGLHNAMKIAAIAESYNVQTAWHGPPDIAPITHAANVHLDVAIPNFGVQELTFFPEVTEAVIQGGPTYRDGRLFVSDAPGLGTDVDEAEAAKHPYERSYLPTVRRADGSVHDW